MSDYQTIKPLGTYSEDIDWDVIYRTFHNPKDIAERIAFELIDHEAPVIFCGFPETAAYLATAVELQFVDKSSVITQRTKERYPDIQSVTEGYISSILKDAPTKNIVISCRLSAFWQTQQAFEEIASAILAHPRDQILIDFFDRDAVNEGMHIYYHTDSEQNETGDLDFKQFDEVEGNNPSIQIANIDVSYNIGGIGGNSDSDSDSDSDMDFSYATRRAFFTKISILNWCTKALPYYEAILSGSLLEGDPSFLLSLKKPIG